MSAATAVRCYLRKDGYRIDDGFDDTVDRHDQAKALEHLGKALSRAIRGDGADPREDGHRYHLEVRGDNNSHLYDVRTPS